MRITELTQEQKEHICKKHKNNPNNIGSTCGNCPLQVDVIHCYKEIPSSISEHFSHILQLYKIMVRNENIEIDDKELV